METQATRNVSGLLTLGLLSLILVACVLGYIFRAKTPGASISVAQLQQEFQSAVQLLGQRQAEKALQEFDRLTPLSGNEQPLNNWIRINGALAALVAGDHKDAASRFERLAKGKPYSTAGNERFLASFFVEASKQLAKPDTPIPASITSQYSNENFEAFGLLCFGVYDWAIGDAANASAIFKSFLTATPPESESWLNELKPMAADYASDCDQVAEIERELVAVRGAESARTLAKKVRAAQDELKLGGKLAARMKIIEADLIAKGANP